MLACRARGHGPGAVLPGQAGDHVRLQLHVRVLGGAVPHARAQFRARRLLAAGPPRLHPGAANSSPGQYITAHLIHASPYFDIKLKNYAEFYLC